MVQVVLILGLALIGLAGLNMILSYRERNKQNRGNKK